VQVTTIEKDTTATNAAPNTKTDDKELKAANAPGEQGGENTEADLESDLPSDPEELKKYILQLRKENAKHRTKAKNLEDSSTTAEQKLQEMRSNLAKALGLEGEDEVSPEEQVQHLTSYTQQLEIQSALMETALVNGVSANELGYFKYLLAERLEALEEGEELGEEEMAEIVGEVKRVSAAKSASTGVGTKAPAPTNTSSGGVTVEQFMKMSVTEKSQLYMRDKSLYERLVEEAKKK